MSQKLQQLSAAAYLELTPGKPSTSSLLDTPPEPLQCIHCLGNIYVSSDTNIVSLIISIISGLCVRLGAYGARPEGWPP